MGRVTKPWDTSKIAAFHGKSQQKQALFRFWIAWGNHGYLQLESSETDLVFYSCPISSYQICILTPSTIIVHCHQTSIDISGNHQYPLSTSISQNETLLPTTIYYQVHQAF